MVTGMDKSFPISTSFFPMYWPRSTVLIRVSNEIVYKEFVLDILLCLMAIEGYGHDSRINRSIQPWSEFSVYLGGLLQRYTMVDFCHLWQASLEERVPRPWDWRASWYEQMRKRVQQSYRKAWLDSGNIPVPVPNFCSCLTTQASTYAPLYRWCTICPWICIWNLPCLSCYSLYNCGQPWKGSQQHVHTIRWERGQSWYLRNDRKYRPSKARIARL